MSAGDPTNKPGPSGTVVNRNETDKNKPLVVAVAQPRRNKKDESINQTKAENFKASLADSNRTVKEFYSSKLHLYEMCVIFGQTIETFPKTVFKSKAKGEPDFEELMALDADVVLSKILQWVCIEQSSAEVNEVLSTDFEWNAILTGLINPICDDVLQKLPSLPSVGVAEGARFFKQLGDLSKMMGKEDAGLPRQARPTLAVFHNYARHMSAALYDRMLHSPRPAKKTPEIKSGKRKLHVQNNYNAGEDGAVADTEADETPREPPFKVPKPMFKKPSVPEKGIATPRVPDSEIHSVLVYLWNKLIGDILPVGVNVEHQVNGSAKTHLVFFCDTTKYELHCKPDGLVQYDIQPCRQTATSEEDRYVPFLVLECKTAIGSGWWKKGMDGGTKEDYTVPVVALSEWTYDQSASSAMSGAEEKKSPNEETETPNAKQPTQTGEAKNTTQLGESPGKGKTSSKGKGKEKLSPELKLGRSLMSARLDKFRSQHVVELATALKKSQSMCFRRKIHGLYVSDHFVFPTTFEACLIEDEVFTDEEKRQTISKCLQYNYVEGVTAVDKFTVESASDSILYKCTRSPIPLNLFCPSHMRAIAKYLRYMVTHYIKKTITEAV